MDVVVNIEHIIREVRWTIGLYIWFI